MGLFWGRSLARGLLDELIDLVGNSRMAVVNLGLDMVRRIPRSAGPVAGLVLGSLLILSGCTIEDWPYYSASMPGGRTVELNRLFRGTWGDEVVYPLTPNAHLSARAICYPRQSDGHQPCRVVIELVSPDPQTIGFVHGQFVVTAPADLPQPWLAGVRACRRGGECFVSPSPPIQESVALDLEYALPPTTFEVTVPNVALNGHRFSPPTITFRYQDTPPHQIVPLFSNY